MARTKKPRRTRQQKSSLFNLENILRTIGFIADMIAIVTVLLAIKLDTASNALPRIFSPWVLFPIWILAAYTYLCWLHSYWEKNWEERNWSKKFKAFIVGDLFVRFRSPFLLMPVLLLAITFILIAKSADILFFVFLPLFFLTFIASFFFPMWWPRVKSALISPQDEEESEKKKQGRIDVVNSRWDELTTIIDKKFEKYVWLEDDNFTELFYVWGLDTESMLYAFAKYAMEHPGKIHFGDVRRRPSGIVETTNALISVERLDRKKYYYG